MPDDAQPGGAAPSTYAYRAFISYSHRDKAFAMRLHRVLENYRIPKKLIGAVTPVGVVPRRLTPIFRDREELPASPDLGGELSRAIRGSMFLIVICSPGAAKSRWVEAEILQFKRAHGESRVLCLIVDGTPNASNTPGKEDLECFPRALRYRLGPDGELSDELAEPIAADMRPHADGKRLAQLKLMAGLTGLKLDQLVQRETQRRIQQMTAVAVGAVGGMVITGGLAIYANAQKIEADHQRNIAQKEAKAAQAASDYLVGTFKLSNPATQNPRTITALDILAQSAERAQTELADQPEIQARLLGTLGRAYNNLGLFDEARAAFAPFLPKASHAGPDGAGALLVLANTYHKQGNMVAAMTTVRQAEAMLGGSDSKKNLSLRGDAALMEGRIYNSTADTKAGVAALNRARALYQAASDTRPDALPTTLGLLGVTQSDDAQYEEADRNLTASLQLFSRALGPHHRSTGQAWSVLAQNSFQWATSKTPPDAAKLRNAEMQITEALAIERNVLEGDNPILGDTLSMQGQILHEEGKLDKAASALREAVAIYHTAFGRPHYLIGIAQLYLGLIESERGRTDAALKVFSEAKHNYDVGYGKLHPNHGDLLVYRAQVLAHAGRVAEAQSDCATGMKILRDTLGAEANYANQMAAKCDGLATPKWRQVQPAAYPAPG